MGAIKVQRSERASASRVSSWDPFRAIADIPLPLVLPTRPTGTTGEGRKPESACLLWPDGQPLSAPFGAGLPGEASVFAGADNKTVFLASRHSPWLVGFRHDHALGTLREFSRVNLGFSDGGVASVAAGGVWVYATGAFADRLVVLRLSHDWYQNRTRLLVMRVVDGGGRPECVASSRDGSLVCVLYCREQTVRMYQCRMNGRLDFLEQRGLSAPATGISLDDQQRTLVVDHGDLGFSQIELESIFEKTGETANVRA